MVIRGVPEKLAKDGWWLNDAPPRRIGPAIVIVVLVGCADLLIWDIGAGLGFVVLILLIAGAAQVMLGRVFTSRRTALAWGVLFVALIPAVDLVQPLSVGFAVLWLLSFAALLTVPEWDGARLMAVVLRLPGVGLLQGYSDLRAAHVAPPSAGQVWQLVRDWLMPLVMGAVFLALLAAANPVLDAWLAEVELFSGQVDFDGIRMLFWLLVALLIWPLLRLTDISPRLTRPLRAVALPRTGLVNARSVMRALLLFNLIFAMQSLLDLRYLLAGAALPEGMTYATYAHRGAYPLLVAALMAGGFALLAQPFLEGRPRLRVMLYIWVAQTILLVISSILRLDLYIAAYGLTQLRFAAMIWMVLVALGLVLMIGQMIWRQSVGWFMARAAMLGLFTLYGIALVNVDGVVARHNLATGKIDRAYLCRLNEGAAPTLRAHGLNCWKVLNVSTPRDWREWGLRNARLRHSE